MCTRVRGSTGFKSNQGSEPVRQANLVGYSKSNIGVLWSSLLELGYRQLAQPVS